MKTYSIVLDGHFARHMSIVRAKSVKHAVEVFNKAIAERDGYFPFDPATEANVALVPATPHACVVTSMTYAE